jgi:hypothetical protein
VTAGGSPAFPAPNRDSDNRSQTVFRADDGDAVKTLRPRQRTAFSSTGGRDGSGGVSLQRSSASGTVDKGTAALDGVTGAGAAGTRSETLPAGTGGHDGAGKGASDGVDKVVMKNNDDQDGDAGDGSGDDGSGSESDKEDNSSVDDAGSDDKRSQGSGDNSDRGSDDGSVGSNDDDNNNDDDDNRTGGDCTDVGSPQSAVVSPARTDVDASPVDEKPEPATPVDEKPEPASPVDEKPEPATLRLPVTPRSPPAAASTRDVTSQFLRRFNRDVPVPASLNLPPSAQRTPKDDDDESHDGPPRSVVIKGNDKSKMYEVEFTAAPFGIKFRSVSWCGCVHERDVV